MRRFFMHFAATLLSLFVTLVHCPETPAAENEPHLLSLYQYQPIYFLDEHWGIRAGFGF